MTEATLTWRPDWAVPPGEILAEALDERSMTQAELARRTNRPLKTINEIVKGKSAITPDTALQFEVVLGVPARFWLNLERDFSERRARVRERVRLERDASWVERFPLTAMVRRGLIPRSNDNADYLNELLKFFAVSSPTAWHNEWGRVQASFRQSSAFAASPESVSVWLRWGELQSQSLNPKPFDEDALAAILPRLREMTRLAPMAFVPELQELLSDCGVAVVLTPEIEGTHLSGAARWLSANKAIVQLSLRHRNDDEFWTALLHELRHLMRSKGRWGYLDALGDATGLMDDESDADHFARELLIPTAVFEVFVAAGRFAPADVRTFASSAGVSEGVVVGRLQRAGQIKPQALNYLKRPLKWSDEAFAVKASTL